ncbi:MAG: transposase [Eubacteriales bacterium]|nr:transposase [Eubacteriales bacterium]
MREYTTPENVRRYRPKGGVIKKIRNSYYVYSEKHIKDEKTGKWKIKSGKIMGKIIPGVGFVASGTPDEETTVVDYGSYHLAFMAGEIVLEELKKYFSLDRALFLYTMAVIDYVNGYTCQRDMEDSYQQSYLSVVYPSAKMTGNSVATVLDDIGRKTETPDAYIQSLIDASKEIAVDGHCIATESKRNSLADHGTKYSKFGSMQMNLLCAYDIDSDSPVYADIFEGGLVDSKSVKDMLERYTFRDKIFVADAGFYSNDNLKLFGGNGCHYIIPLRMNFTETKEAVKNLDLRNEFAFRKSSESGTVIRWKETVKEGCRIIVFRDEQENLNDRLSYNAELEKGTAGYSQEEFQRLKDLFGVIVLKTDIMDANAEMIYGKYKKRWRIETYCDHLKNETQFRSIGESDYYTLRGLSFVSLLEGRIHSELMRKKNASHQLRPMSAKELLIKANFLKAKKEGGIWRIANAKKKAMEIFQGLDIDVPTTISVGQENTPSD